MRVRKKNVLLYGKAKSMLRCLLITTAKKQKAYLKERMSAALPVWGAMLQV